MANLKSLAKDTAIYGVSSILARFLNYMLVPIQTHALLPEQYGITTNIYAYVGLLIVMLTFGMETAFFRYINKEEYRPMEVYSTTLLSVSGVCLMFIAGTLMCLKPLAGALGYEHAQHYVSIMFICAAVDAFCTIPLAYLRYQKKSLRFLLLNVSKIILTVGLNVLYFIILPKLYDNGVSWAMAMYNPNVNVGYVFGINLLTSVAFMALLIPELSGFKWVFNPKLMKQMWKYAWPMLILGVAGLLSQHGDKIIFTHVLGGEEGRRQLGIYGGCVKIAVIMSMITQAFRYAYDPFVFSAGRDRNSKETFAAAMKYFIIFTLLAFLGVMGFMDVLKYMVDEKYWEGLRVIPIVMGGLIMFGIYYNLSNWYKLIDKTIYGAVFSCVSSALFLVLNYLLIPSYGYMACAWAGFASYGVAMLMSYAFERRLNPMPYDLKGISAYIGLAVVLFAAMCFVPDNWHVAARIGAKVALICVYFGYTIKMDFPLSKVPVIGRFFR